jgi:phage baseplate assembly protein W
MSSTLSDYNVKRASNIAKNSVFADLDLKFRRHPNTGDIRPLTDIDAVKNAVKNILLTVPGERPFRPDIGSGITGLLFENADAFTMSAIKENIALTLQRYEPRINELVVEINDNPDRNAYFVQLTFTVINSSIPEDINFYLERLR